MAAAGENGDQDDESYNNLKSTDAMLLVMYQHAYSADSTPLSAFLLFGLGKSIVISSPREHPLSNIKSLLLEKFPGK